MGRWLAHKRSRGTADILTNCRPAYIHWKSLECVLAGLPLLSRSFIEFKSKVFQSCFTHQYCGIQPLKVTQPPSHIKPPSCKERDGYGLVWLDMDGFNQIYSSNKLGMSPERDEGARHPNAPPLMNRKALQPGSAASRFRTVYLKIDPPK